MDSRSESNKFCLQNLHLDGISLILCCLDLALDDIQKPFLRFLF